MSLLATYDDAPAVAADGDAQRRAPRVPEMEAGIRPARLNVPGPVEDLDFPARLPADDGVHVACLIDSERRDT
jgi:hypothetical protein